MLAVQGGFDRHIAMLGSLGIAAIPIRYADQIKNLRGLIIPGGESTVISYFMLHSGIADAIDAAIRNRRIILFATCAGAIILAREIEPVHKSENTEATQKINILPVLDICICRNAYGRQIESFETKLYNCDRRFAPFLPAVFIRAPIITQAGENISVLAQFEEHPVLVASPSIIAAAYHPELTDDTRIHQFFIEQTKNL